MISKKFSIVVTILVLFIVLVSFAFSWTLSRDNMLVTSASLVLILILLLFYLLWYTKKVNRDLVRFFQSFKFSEDFSHFKIESTDLSFRELYNEFNKISQAFLESRKEKELEHLFFRNTVENIGTGILAFDDDDNIELKNKSLLDQLGIDSLAHIDRLDDIKEGFRQKLQSLKPGRQELIRIPVQTQSPLLSPENKELIANAREFRFDNKTIKLISFHDIGQEIEKKESKAWQNLLRIITHEIMNSVSPINLLTTSLIEMHEKEEKNRSSDQKTDSCFDQTMLGLYTIRKRGQGLTQFIDTYKDLAEIPPPVFSSFKVNELVNHLYNFLQPNLKEAGISFSIEIFPKDLTVVADEKLIEQVCINLITNAIFALQETEHPRIIVTARVLDKKAILSISDNGKGIEEMQLDQIFVPFYTTREGGSGLGLSLCRQIMNRHHGSIRVWSKPGQETIFSLVFA